MSITKRIEHDCSVLSDGQIQVREVTIIEEDGKELTRTYHRHVVDVGDDVTNEPDLIKSIAQAVHTPERVAARAQAKANAKSNIV